MKTLKNIVLIALALVYLSSCTTTVYQMHLDCEGKPEDTFRSITTILLKNGFKIEQSDLKLGYLSAQTPLEYSFLTGGDVQKEWVFQLDNGRYTAYATLIVIQKNIFGATTGQAKTYFSDRTHKDNLWYWNVRNNLQKICSNIRFTTNTVNRQI